MDPVFQAHPIPQNVTNFEFHLVGDMTLKQFGYLAAGLGFAFLIFTTLSTVQPIIAWPIIVISALLGVAFAFLPIQERPLDHWVAAFFRAIFKPTSLKYSSKIINPQDPLFNRRLSHYLKTYKVNEARAHAPLGNPNLLPTAFSSPASAAKTATGPIPKTQMTGKKQTFIDKFKAGQTSFAPPVHERTAHSVQGTAAAQGGGNSVQGTPIQGTEASVQRIVKNQNNLTLPSTLNPVPSVSPGILRNPQVINQLPQDPIPTRFRPAAVQSPSKIEIVPSSEESKPKPEPAKPQDLKKTVELAKEAQATQQEIVKIEASLSQIKQQAGQPGADPRLYLEQFEDLLTSLQKLNEKASDTAEKLAKISNLPPEPQPATSDQLPVTSPEPVKAKSIPTLRLTSFPNVLNGIVTDSQGNYIEGAIVVAHDKQGLPVRALKSNKLGQFVAATPLPNGDYAIVVEKDSLRFDKVGIELNNEILPPILIAAKKMQTAT